MKTAHEMYTYCQESGFLPPKNTLKGFALIEGSLLDDEVVLMCFTGHHNFVSLTKNQGIFSYAITANRIVMAQKFMARQVLQSVYLDTINDVKFETGLVWYTIEIDTLKESIKILLPTKPAAEINSRMQNTLNGLKRDSKAPLVSESSPLDELKKCKELLDMGIITQEDFDAKKQQLLGI